MLSLGQDQVFIDVGDQKPLHDLGRGAEQGDRAVGGAGSERFTWFGDGDDIGGFPDGGDCGGGYRYIEKLTEV